MQRRADSSPCGEQEDCKTVVGQQLQRLISTAAKTTLEWTVTDLHPESSFPALKKLYIENYKSEFSPLLHWREFGPSIDLNKYEK